MTDPAKYWPGGIPDDIRCDPVPFEGDLREEIKGWQLFLKETATGRDQVGETEEKVDENFEVTQRRRLVTEWARMTQEERDSYQSRAPVRQPLNAIYWYPSEKLADPEFQVEGSDSWTNRHDKGAEEKCVVCIAATAATAAVAEEGSPPLNPRDAALWAKQRIHSYRLDGTGARQCFLASDDAEHGVGVAVPNAAGGDQTTVSPHGFLRWCHLEAADFRRMAMTPRGTVLFLSDRPGVLFVDREALDTGPALLCALENNGAVSFSRRVWPFTLKNEWSPDTCSAERILRENNVIAKLGIIKRTNMEKGIIDILKEFGKFFGGKPELWRYLIERCAPGYLELGGRAKAWPTGTTTPASGPRGS
ncbi:cytochrome P450 [Apiospora marii]|uniref:Cytochrome P450 n=1 Tax=Apiospora marii TaxID=335849 RepID=A0ABR1SSJ6_9PEZI